MYVLQSNLTPLVGAVGLVKEQIINIDMNTRTSATPAEARAYRASELEKWGKLVSEIGVKVE